MKPRWLRLRLLLFVLGGMAVVAAFVLWFVGIWTHGHDAASRFSGSGFLSLIVGGALLITAACIED